MNMQSPPPPPGDQFNQDPFASDPGFQEVSLDQGKPQVSASPNKVFAVLGGLILVIAVIIIQVFFGGGDNDDVPPPAEQPVVTANPQIDTALTELPDDLPPPPLPPMTMPELPMEPTQPIQLQNDGPTNELLQQRLRSNMLVSGGGALAGLGGGDDEEAFLGSPDPNLQFAGQVYSSNTRAAKEEATHIGNLAATVAQGKIIQGVLETAINTDLPGNIRAIVSRDIFPEAGDKVIVPKGSRLIGQYNSSVLGGQKRVYVVWTRLIRPDGVDVMINSPLIDQIGQAGVAGHVDSKFAEIFSRALLTSVVTISVAMIADEINGNESLQQTNNTDGSVSQSGDLTTAAAVQASAEFGGVMSNFLRQFINVKPTILVDQGTPVNVFVNRDLIFPSAYQGAAFVN